MVIGLTGVWIGTSLPALAIGIDAARSGSPALAVGNIVGTNLVNLLFAWRAACSWRRTSRTRTAVVRW